MSNPLLIKSWNAEGAIAAFRIVKYGAADGGVLQATAVTEALLGVSGELAAAASGDRIDIVEAGIADVEYGGTVTRGGLLTSDANGKAVAAAPAVGVNNAVIGRARVSGAAGDIGSVNLNPGQIQGA
jgi:hypothetical protein